MLKAKLKPGMGQRGFSIGDYNIGDKISLYNAGLLVPRPDVEIICNYLEFYGVSANYLSAGDYNIYKYNPAKGSYDLLFRNNTIARPYVINDDFLYNPYPSTRTEVRNINTGALIRDVTAPSLMTNSDRGIVCDMITGDVYLSTRNILGVYAIARYNKDMTTMYWQMTLPGTSGFSASGKIEMVIPYDGTVYVVIKNGNDIHVSRGTSEGVFNNPVNFGVLYNGNACLVPNDGFYILSDNAVRKYKLDLSAHIYTANFPHSNSNFVYMFHLQDSPVYVVYYRNLTNNETYTGIYNKATGALSPGTSHSIIRLLAASGYEHGVRRFAGGVTERAGILYDNGFVGVLPLYGTIR